MSVAYRQPAATPAPPIASSGPVPSFPALGADAWGNSAAADWLRIASVDDGGQCKADFAASPATATATASPSTAAPAGDDAACDQVRGPGGTTRCEDGPAPEATVDVVPQDGTAYSYLNEATHPGSVHPTSIQDMVDQTLDQANGEPIRRLDILGHGLPGNQGVSSLPVCGPNDGVHESLRTDDLCTTSNPDWSRCDSDETAQMARLSGHFAPDGEIDLSGCNVAEGDDGQRLLAEVAEATGAPTVGGVSAQRGYVAPVLGTSVRCVPDPHGGPATCTTTPAAIPGEDTVLDVPDYLAGPMPSVCLGPR